MKTKQNDNLHLDKMKRMYIGMWSYRFLDKLHGHDHIGLNKYASYIVTMKIYWNIETMVGHLVFCTTSMQWQATVMLIRQ